MNRGLESELRDLLTSVESIGNDSLLLAFRYPPAFSGFQGHFPGNPILPGVCMLQSLRLGLQRALNQAFRLTTISRARFSSPVRPDDSVVFHAHIVERSESAVSVKTTVKRDGNRVADFLLTFAPESKEESR